MWTCDIAEKYGCRKYVDDGGVDACIAYSPIGVRTRNRLGYCAFSTPLQKVTDTSAKKRVGQQKGRKKK